jgi:glycosyltransferase involved in cell wall biosynthesis
MKFSANEIKRKLQKICMVSYTWQASNIPPMYNEGIFLANAGIETEVICFTIMQERPKLETIAPNFLQKRIFLFNRKILFKPYREKPTSVFVAAIRFLLTYSEYTIKIVFKCLCSKADLYVAHDLPTLLPTLIAAKLKRKPIVYNAHELYADMSETAKVTKFWRFLERRLIPAVQVVITPNENRAEIIHHESKPKKYPLVVLNCSPYQEFVASTKLRDELAINNFQAKRIALYQGLIHSDRCIDELVYSTKYFLNNTMLVIIGSGYGEYSETSKLMDRSKKVFVLPQVPYSDLKRYTASADIGILFYRNTNRNNYYCAPNKLFEYMMAGLPIVTCDYPGLKKIIEGERVGLCVNPENPVEIADAINKLTTDDELYREMRANCLKLSREKYNWEKEFKKIINLYYNIIEAELKQ